MGLCYYWRRALIWNEDRPCIPSQCILFLQVRRWDVDAWCFSFSSRRSMKHGGLGLCPTIRDSEGSLSWWWSEASVTSMYVLTFVGEAPTFLFLDFASLCKSFSYCPAYVSIHEVLRWIRTCFWWRYLGACMDVNHVRINPAHSGPSGFSSVFVRTSVVCQSKEVFGRIQLGFS